MSSPVALAASLPAVRLPRGDEVRNAQAAQDRHEFGTRHPRLYGFLDGLRREGMRDHAQARIPGSVGATDR